MPVLSGRKKQIVYSLKVATQKATNYCAYQERSHKEVRHRLYEMGLYGEEVENVLTELILGGFVNEERFAKAYVGGKFRIKKWGRKRIHMGLKEYNISSYCLKKGMEEIDEEDYLDTLEELIQKKSVVLQEEDIFKKRNKVASHVIRKGYESELVWDLIKSLIQ